ncbi:hypothetical protein ACF0H5_007622 [Mactra antiquata]
MSVSGHGRLIEPPSRSSMWRFGFQTPINYDDNQLFCGGYDVQWKHNGGRCGVCGDSYNGPRENEAGGRYATGTISRHYSEGQIISVSVEVTTNHGGYFEFRLCPNNNPSRPATEACFNQYLLHQPSGETKWQLPTGTKAFPVRLVLPRGLTCSQCILQWKWNTASNWDCDVNNRCCKGCGPQEQFYGCADVSISSANTNTDINNMFAQSNTFSSTNNVINGFPLSNTYSNTNSGNTGLGQFNIGINSIGSQSGHLPIDSPTGVNTQIGASTGSTTCGATAVWKAKFAYADDWCVTQCAAGNCPVQYCVDACRNNLG